MNEPGNEAVTLPKPVFSATEEDIKCAANSDPFTNHLLATCFYDAERQLCVALQASHAKDQAIAELKSQWDAEHQCIHDTIDAKAAGTSTLIQQPIYVACVGTVPTLSTTPHEIADVCTQAEVVELWNRLRELYTNSLQSAHAKDQAIVELVAALEFTRDAWMSGNNFPQRRVDTALANAHKITGA